MDLGKANRREIGQHLAITKTDLTDQLDCCEVQKSESDESSTIKGLIWKREQTSCDGIQLVFR